MISAIFSLACMLNPKDTPIIGTYVSDRDRTLEEIRNRTDIDASHRELFERADFFGNLEVTYEPQKIISNDGQVKSSEPYKVIDVHNEYVLIKNFNRALKHFETSKIYFDDKWIWMDTSKYHFMEYFKRREGSETE